MGWESAAIMAGGNILGGMLSGDAARGAASDSAAAQLQAAQIAADAQRFRPVGITSRFGTSNFGFDSSGNLASAGYQLSPELQSLQDQIMASTRASLGDVGQLQALGRGYLAQTPQQAAADWMSKQQALLQPSRDLQYANMQQNLFNTGRGGLSVAQGGSLGAANPEAQAYYNALAQQDAQLAAQAQQAGQQQTTYGLGLLSSAYEPFQTGLGLGTTLEQLGQSPLDIGAQLGGRSATAGANVGRSLLAGGLGAAKTMQAANSFSPVGSTLMGLSQNPYFAYSLGQGLSGGNTPMTYSPMSYTGMSPVDYGFQPIGGLGLSSGGGLGPQATNIW